MSTSLHKKRAVMVVKALELPTEILDDTTAICNIDELVKERKNLCEKIEDILRSWESKYITVEDNFLEKKKVNEVTTQNKIKYLREEKFRKQNTIHKAKLVLEEVSTHKKIVEENQNAIKEKENIYVLKEQNAVRDHATFALFSSTFSLRWDYTSSDEELKGILMGKKNFTPFCLKKKNHNKLNTVNYLWDMIELSK